MSLSVRNTRGALAKAILTLPDEQRLYNNAALRASLLTSEIIPVIPVDPFGTSQSKHHGCSANVSGCLKRSLGQYDEVTCNACGEQVNIHENAARDILKKLIFSIKSIFLH